MKLKDRLRALQMLWEMNDTVVHNVPAQYRNELQDRILELRQIVERQTRQGSPR